ncbi:hypothetical protein BDW02DRAFT_569070 [Decorospora gaudefroyi]|uniref:RRM domain-containing protein n=1 Tax=Decorospora gaudefroyi TaxID=184978 RepID=A0A6A5KEI4_9PLEO|nr:hypothetical protein BDW02DRAFT_569070 [Decorospora gaudefroyi]
MLEVRLSANDPQAKIRAPEKSSKQASASNPTTMSKATDMAPQEEVEAVSKKERREKKERKEKTEKKEKKEKKDKKRSRSEPNTDAAAVDSSEEAAATPAKKRKREALPDEIEIDVSLPEPASKKAARKAKKTKPNPAPTADTDGTETDSKAKDEKESNGKRSGFGVWIGNLPWSATKESIRKFLTDNTEIKSEQITRIHLPPPTKPVNPSWTTKPLNKGFAYVDFSTELAMYSAIALTETKMDGRALLIKNAKSFEGRPDKPKTDEDNATGPRGGKGATKGAHPPNKRVFVGNLSFDVTKEDLETHYTQCGLVEHIHMATFEDSGKCKGYAWITFDDVDAATSAVRGFLFKDEAHFTTTKKNNKVNHHSDGDDDADDADTHTNAKTHPKKRKWLVNKLMGRDLRCEFAEDATSRYNKRYGKDKPVDPVEGVNPDRWKNFGSSTKPHEQRRHGAPGHDDGRASSKRKVDPRSIRSGAAHSSAQRASQAI